MKKIISLLIVLVWTSAISQTVLRLQKVENYDYLTDDMVWEPDDEDIYSYDNEGTNETSLLNIVYTNGVPVEDFKYLKTYNSYNSLTQNTKQNKVGMDWINDTRNTRIYDGENLIQTSLDEVDKGAGWENQSLAEYEYLDESTTIQKEYEPDGNTWFLNRESTLTVSSTSWIEIVKSLDLTETLVLSRRNETIFVDGKLDEQISQIWDNNSWLYTSRYKVHNDSEGQREKEEIFEWNSDLMPANWELTTQILHTRADTNPKLIILYQDCGTGGCEDTQRTLIHNYPDNRVEKSTLQIWDLDESGEWTDWRESMYVYETNKETITSKRIDFFTGGIFGLSTQTIKYYEEGATFSATFDSLISVQPYPNPTTDAINLKFKNPIVFNTEAKLYDLTGKLINNNIIKKGSSAHKMSISYNTNGIYILHLRVNGLTEVFKIIKDN